MSNTIEVRTDTVLVPVSAILWTDTSNTNRVFTPDAVLSEKHEITSMVTEHPVEEGVNITDHVRPNVDHVSLDIFVSQSPLSAPGLDRQAVTLQLPQPPLTINGTSFGPVEVSPTLDVLEAVKDFVADALTTFRYLRDTATLVTVALPHWTYYSMLLEAVHHDRTKDTGLGGFFTLDFKQIRVVRASLTDAPVGEPTAAPEKADGNKAMNVPKKSVAAALQDKIGSIANALTGH